MAEPNQLLNDTSKLKRRGESILILLFSGVIVGVICLALWISVTSIFEKFRISQGLQQVISVVTVTRDSVKADPAFAASGPKDLLALLEHAGRLQTDGAVDGVKILRNPWNNSLIALVDANGNVRVETIVPPHICQRFIGSFGQDPQTYGVTKVEVKSDANTWRPVYEGNASATINESNIAAGCNDTLQADVALTFSLH